MDQIISVFTVFATVIGSVKVISDLASTQRLLERVRSISELIDRSDLGSADKKSLEGLRRRALNALVGSRFGGHEWLAIALMLLGTVAVLLSILFTKPEQLVIQIWFFVGGAVAAIIGVVLGLTSRR